MSRKLDAAAAARERAEERLGVALGLLEDGIAAILDGPTFAAYLRTMARFHAYSARNVALIHHQRPDATQVAGYRAWQALGRQVRRGERGIRILAPYRRAITEAATDEGIAADATDARAIAGFGVATVFDIGQTEGDPLPEPPRPAALAGATDTGAWLAARLAAFLAGEGVAVATGDTGRANGQYWPRERRVVLSERLAGDQAARTLAHEAAHHVAATRAIPEHGTGRADAETIAEGAAYVALHHAGLDAGGYTFAYVARWAADRAVLLGNLAAIRVTAATLIHAIAGAADAGEAAA